MIFDDYIAFISNKKFRYKYYNMINNGENNNDSFFDLSNYLEYIKITNCDCNGRMGIYCKKCRGFKKILSTEEYFFSICDNCIGLGEVIKWKNNRLDGLRICDKCKGRGVITWLDDFLD